VCQLRGTDMARSRPGGRSTWAGPDGVAAVTRCPAVTQLPRKRHEAVTTGPQTARMSQEPSMTERTNSTLPRDSIMVPAGNAAGQLPARYRNHLLGA
jgi:hypothetical protein